MKHDRSYKLIFSNPEMIRDLLCGFVHEPWVAEIDFDSLQRQPNSYVADNLQGREDDLVWRVNLRGKPAYVYILLEFQSEVDASMALRVMGYLSLLYQDLIAGGQVAGDKLPPVFPIVLYNGRGRWKAKRDVFDLIEEGPQGLLAYLPRLRYFLLEIGVMDEAAQFAMQNLVAAMVRLEKSRNPQAMLEAVRVLRTWLQSPARRRLRRCFSVWIGRVLLPSRLPGVARAQMKNVLEDSTMLAERVMEWTAQWKAEGHDEGHSKGMQEGHSKGMQEGQVGMLRTMLEAKFGPLPAWALARLQDSSAEELTRWSIRLLSQAELAEVLN